MLLLQLVVLVYANSSNMHIHFYVNSFQNFFDDELMPLQKYIGNLRDPNHTKEFVIKFLKNFFFS